MELPVGIAAAILRKVNGDEAHWYTVFLGVRCITIQTRLPSWAGMGTYRDKMLPSCQAGHDVSLDVLIHKMLPSEFGELFQAGHKTLGLWFKKHPAAKTVVADIYSVIPKWEDQEEFPSYHFIELRRRDRASLAKTCSINHFSSAPIIKQKYPAHLSSAKILHVCQQIAYLPFPALS